MDVDNTATVKAEVAARIDFMGFCKGKNRALRSDKFCDKQKWETDHQMNGIRRYFTFCLYAL